MRLKTEYPTPYEIGRLTTLHDSNEAEMI